MVFPLRQVGVVQTEAVQAMRESTPDVDPLLNYLGCEDACPILVASLEEGIEDVGLRVDDQ